MTLSGLPTRLLITPPLTPEQVWAAPAMRSVRLLYAAEPRTEYRALLPNPREDLEPADVIAELQAFVDALPGHDFAEHLDIDHQGTPMTYRVINRRVTCTGPNGSEYQPPPKTTWIRRILGGRRKEQR